MLNGNRSSRNHVSGTTALIEMIYVISLGLILAIICSCCWKFVNAKFNFDHNSYGINLIQYGVIKLSRFAEHQIFNIDNWFDILKMVYGIFMYYVFPIVLTSGCCRFYQSMLNDCKSNACKLVGMVIITLILLSFCICMFLDILSVLRIVQESNASFGYVLTTMTN